MAIPVSTMLLPSVVLAIQRFRPDPVQKFKR